jgi:hypothetical protein
MEFTPSLFAGSAQSAKLNWESLANLPAGVAAELYATNNAIEFRLDLFEILSHEGLLWLLSVVSSRGPTRLSFVRLPERPNALRFLLDLKFMRVLQRVGGLISNEAVLYGLKHTDEAKGERTHTPRSLRFIQVVNSSTYSLLLQELFDYFDRDVAELLGLSRTGAMIMDSSRAFQQAIGELLINVALHAGIQDGAGFGYACYRPFPKGHGLIRFCCSDPGPGFKATLERHSELKCESEEAAVLNALLYRHLFPRDRVVGLFGALPFIRALHGAMRIRSGHSLIEIDFGNAKSRELFDSGSDSPSLQWIKQLARISQAAPIQGCYLALDLSVNQGRRRG